MSMAEAKASQSLECDKCGQIQPPKRSMPNEADLRKKKQRESQS